VAERAGPIEERPAIDDLFVRDTTLGEEVGMDELHIGRRDFLKEITALGMAGVPIVAGWRPSVARADETKGGPE